MSNLTALILTAVLGAAFIVLTAKAHAGAVRRAHENAHVKVFCAGALEHTLADNTRVDCLTDTHAIEYDFANKWAEAVGQALHYALMSNRAAGIVMLINTKLGCTPETCNNFQINREIRLVEKDAEKLQRVCDLVNAYDLPIDLWAASVISQADYPPVPNHELKVWEVCVRSVD